MSNRPTPAPDPVEDRLRRTFAVKAEDMAPGDADDTSPDLILLRPAHAPSPSRRPLQAAAVVLVTHDRSMLRAAVTQGTLPLLAVVLLLLQL